MVGPTSADTSSPWVLALGHSESLPPALVFAGPVVTYVTRTWYHSRHGQALGPCILHTASDSEP